MLQLINCAGPQVNIALYTSAASLSQIFSISLLFSFIFRNKALEFQNV